MFEYSIDTLAVDWGTRRLLTLPFKLNNALTFFHIQAPATTGDATAGAGAGSGGDAGSGQQQQHQALACARSKLGGTMLLIPEPAGTSKYSA